MSNIAISVENISKQYRLGEVSTGTISHDLNRWWAKLRGKEDPFLRVGEANDRTKKGTSDLVWALKDVNFDVKQGEVLGIIGRNGAGKSTLLKVLSKVTQPTTGNIKVRGRIASLLEVGTGFHPELTGRENIYLNGAILGMTKSEISRKFDEILDFSGVERYVDTPVKRYSSGMYVRLAFAVAAHLEPEILIVDEVLAVGDAEFQKKCLGKMKDVSGEGRTVLFVSHNMGAVRGLCNTGLFMNNGTVGMFGDIQSAVDLYLTANTNADGIFQLGRQGKEEIVVFEKVILRNQFGIQTQNYNFGDSISIEIECSSDQEVELPYFWISIESQFGSLCAANSLLDGIRPKFVRGKFIIACTFKNLKLLPQSFIIFAGGRLKSGTEMSTRSKEIGSFTMVSKLNEIGLNGELAESFAPSASPLYIPYSWRFNNEESIDVNL